MQFFVQNQLYIVLSVVLLIWGGISAYLIRLDRKVTALEKLMKKGS
jgi:CcmD family protein